MMKATRRKHHIWEPPGERSAGISRVDGYAERDESLEGADVLKRQVCTIRGVLAESQQIDRSIEEGVWRQTGIRQPNSSIGDSRRGADQHRRFLRRGKTIETNAKCPSSI